MSDNWLVLIPTDPNWQPTEAASDAATEAMTDLLPEAGEISVIFTDAVEFIDAGENFDSVACPFCGSDLADWWGGAMDRAADGGFRNLAVTTPCCGKPSSLNDLTYVLGQGFARYSISVGEPGEELEPEDLEIVADVLGHPVRAVYRDL